jgi:lipoprotein NlpI
LGNHESASPYFERGRAKLHNKDIPGSLSDFTKAIAIDPGHAYAFWHRGVARILDGEYEGARMDFRRSNELTKGPKWSAQLFVFLLNLRLKYPQSLLDFKASVHGWKNEWEKAIGRFLANEIDEPTFLALAAQGDAQTIGEHQCQAYYYAGMLRLLNGEAAVAQTLFEKSLATKVSYFVEFDFVGAELARLRTKR